MPDDLNKLFENGSTPSVFSVQITGEQMKNLLDLFYSKGKDDGLKEAEAARLEKESENVEYITRKEAQGMLKRAKATLCQWEKKGYLKQYRIGGRIIYRKDDVDAILNRNRT